MSSKGKIGGFIASRCLSDPYVQLLHCKRTVRFLKAAKAGGAHMLILGNKYQNSINFGGLLSSTADRITKVTADVITNATRHYDLILCLDPILYAKHLYNINLPCIAICNVEDLYHHRDIPDAFDYIIPFSSEELNKALVNELLNK